MVCERCKINDFMERLCYHLAHKLHVLVRVSIAVKIEHDRGNKVKHLIGTGLQFLRFSRFCHARSIAVCRQT